MLRRSLVVVTIVALLGAALPFATTYAAQTTQIAFWTLALSPFFDDEMNQLAADFEALHPGVQVKWTDVPYSAMQQKLLSAIAAGNPPDVVNISSDMSVKLYQQGALEPLNRHADEGAFEVYYPKALTAVTDAGTGDVIGAPWYWAPKVLAYNAEIFARAGLDPDNPPTTFEAMVEAAKQIKDRTGLYGFMPNIDSTGLLLMFQEAGLPILSEDGSRAVFNSPEHVAVVQQMVDLYEQDYIPEDTMRRGYVGATELYTAGSLGMLLTGPQFLIRVRTDNEEVYDTTRVAPYPLGKGDVLHTALMGFSVPANARNKELGVEFALFATNDRNQLAFAKASDTFPSTMVAGADRYFTTPGPEAADQARVAGAARLPFAQDLTIHVPDASRLFQAFKDNMEAAFFGTKDVQQALDDAVRTWNASL